VTYFVSIVVGAALLTLPLASADGGWSSPIVALFTATSAVCLAGLVLVDTATAWSPFGQAVILVLIQLGGIGFMTGASLAFILLGRRLTLQERLLVRESVGAFALGEAASLAKRVALTMVIIEAVGAALLFATFVSERPLAEALWFAVFHAISAFNNAGFDVMGGFRSVTSYQTNAAVLLPMAALIMLGGISYMTLAELARRRSIRRLSVDSKLVLLTTVILWLLGTAVFLVSEWRNPATLAPLSLPEKLLNAFFQSVTVRSAGFNALDVAALSQESQFFSVALMFIGGASASTAGGIRLNTFSLLFFAILAAARGSTDVVAFGRTVPTTLVFRALAIALLSVAFVFAATFLLAVVESAAFLSLLFETVSAFGSVGQTTGLTPSLSPTGALIVAATMAVGRLGPLTLAVILAGRVRSARIRPAEDVIRVG
jgi:trk system potassium uptake protein TrkH